MVWLKCSWKGLIGFVGFVWLSRVGIIGVCNFYFNKIYEIDWLDCMCSLMRFEFFSYWISCELMYRNCVLIKWELGSYGIIIGFIFEEVF